jgi:hypothetical protein
MVWCNAEWWWQWNLIMCYEITWWPWLIRVFLQNCLESQKDVPNLRSEACALSSDDVDQAVNIKIEKCSDVEDAEDPVPITFTGIKAEHEVSSVSLVCALLHIAESHPELPFSLLSASVTQNLSSRWLDEVLKIPLKRLLVRYCLLCTATSLCYSNTHETKYWDIWRTKLYSKEIQWSFDFVILNVMFCDTECYVFPKYRQFCFIPCKCI